MGTTKAGSSMAQRLGLLCLLLMITVTIQGEPNLPPLPQNRV
jgi:hypothetical protein